MEVTSIQLSKSPFWAVVREGNYLFIQIACGTFDLFVFVWKTIYLIVLYKKLLVMAGPPDEGRSFFEHSWCDQTHHFHKMRNMGKPETDPNSSYFSEWLDTGSPPLPKDPLCSKDACSAVLGEGHASFRFVQLINPRIRSKSQFLDIWFVIFFSVHFFLCSPHSSSFFLDKGT